MSGTWGVVILAGGEAKNGLPEAMGTPRKALAPITGKPSLQWMVEAIQAGNIPYVAVTGEDVAARIPNLNWVPESVGAIENAILGAEALGLERIVVIPSDAPHLNAAAIRHFMQRVDLRLMGTRPGDSWFAAGLCPEKAFKRRYPNVPASGTRTRDAMYLSGGLYASSLTSMRQSQSLVIEFRKNRNSPFKIAKIVGWKAIWGLVAGRFDLKQIEEILAKVSQGKVILVPDCAPESCLDFDTPAEYELVKEMRP